MPYEHPQEAVNAPPIIKLVAATREARASLGGRPEVRSQTFPFNLGRESRVATQASPGMKDLRLGVAPQVNDVYLLESKSAHLLYISRTHFAIEHANDQFVLVDRGSACGTIVAGKHVGGDRTGGRAEVRNGDEIIVGTASSPFVFRFEVVTEHVTDPLSRSLQMPALPPPELRSRWSGLVGPSR